MIQAQDNGDWFDRDSGEVTEIEAGSLIPVETETVMVREDTAPTLVDPNQLPDFETMEPGFSMAQQYVRFTTPGQSARGILLGFNAFKSTDGKEKRIAIFQNKQGVWANAGDNLMSQIEHLPKGTPLEVTYTGDKKTNRGFTVKTFEVRLLNPKPAPEIPDIPPGIPPMNKKKQPA